MIRAVWTALVAAVVTFYWGPQVLFQAWRGRKGLDWYIHVTRSWARAIMWGSGCRVVVHGMENARPGRPQVIVSNHVSWFDVFAIASVVEGNYHFVAKKELESIPLFGPAWQAAGHISIDRSNRERAIASLAEAGEKIRRESSSVIIFPEGTRSRSGRLQPFKKGAFQLARSSNVAVVPTVVTGSREVMPSGAWTVRPNTIHVHFLPPIPAGSAAGTEELMEEVYDVMLRKLLDERALPAHT